MWAPFCVSGVVTTQRSPRLRLDQTSSNLVLSQMTVRHKQTDNYKQANRKSISALVWGSLRLAPKITVYGKPGAEVNAQNT